MHHGQRPYTEQVSRATTQVQNRPSCRYTPVCFMKITRSAQHFDSKDHSEAKHGSSQSGISNPTGESQHYDMSRNCVSLRVNEQGGQTKRNVMQPHVPSVKVPH